ncbi:hypothetical protein ABIE09_001869 [Lysobacter enzymogenes]|uniref:hypothetical protein n=1 Tax=Lysobacter enzymogenes TaxID=69 RepID=UPI000899311F|nr:hypothetical protein [Lysobacter enzymogenes]SDX73020.1 hypothetical protein SAMN05421681_107161 [Lysobacter enzymogenes]
MSKANSAIALATLGLALFACSTAANATLVQTIRTVAFNYPGGSQQQYSAMCDPGEKVSGGGYQINSGYSIFIFANAPVVAPNGTHGWTLRFTGIPSGSPTIGGTVYAICLKEQ